METNLRQFILDNNLPVKYSESYGIIKLTPMGLDIEEIDEICVRFGGRLVDSEIIINGQER